MSAAAAVELNAGQGSTTDKLRRLIDELPDLGLTLGAVADRLGATGTGLCLLLFSLTALIPGIAPVFGVALCAVAIGMVLGRSKPLLPEWLRRRQLDRGRVSAGLRRLTSPITWLERWLQPRQQHLLRGTGTRLIGLASLINGILIVLPIPFGNTAPAIAMLVLSFGVVQADGIAVGVGLLMTVIAVAVDIGMIALGYTAVAGMITYLF